MLHVILRRTRYEIVTWFLIRCLFFSGEAEVSLLPKSRGGGGGGGGGAWFTTLAQLAMFVLTSRWHWKSLHDGNWW